MKKRRVLLGILAIIAVIVIGFVIKNFASNMYDDLANSSVELTAEEKIIKEKDNNPEGKYLVTDKYISGILPQTSVAEFKKSFDNDEVKVYSDRACENEVTSGNVASGMFAKYEANGRIFEISVLGDINQSTISEEIVENDTAKILKGDSNLNEIECTRVIRGYLESDNWKIIDEAEFKSADVTSNRKLEDADIKSIVNYIVFGELDAPEFDKIDSPSLKVIKGIKNEDGSFEGEATVKLTQNAENGTNNKYKIYKYGETPDINDDTEYLEATDGEEIKLTEAGKYAIVAYTYGELENKSKSEIKVLEVKPGIYRLTLIAGDNIKSVLGSGEYKIGTKVNISAVLKENTPGYEYSWGMWTSNNTSLVSNQANQNAEIIMPKGDVTLTANGNKQIIEYSIKYNLKDGIVSAENPTSYNIETPTFTLNNPSKTGYKFLGWTGTGLEEGATTVTVQSGSTGDREYTANWEKLPPVTYKVEHYKENLTGNSYTLAETVEDTADIGTTVNATIKNYTGFTFNENESLNKLSGTIVEGENLVLKVYYKRNTYELTLDKNENIQSVSGAGTYKFEETVNISAVLKTEAGYSFSFDKWESGNTDLLVDQTDREKEFTMPAGDLSLTAIGTKTARTDTEYKLEFYYQTNGAYPETATSTTTKYGTTGQTAEVQEIEKYPSIAGYVFDELNANNVLSGTIAGDGSLVLKVYFKQQFTVKYKPGTQGTFVEQVTNGLDYNSTTPSFVGNITCNPGYEFTGWDREVKDKVTTNLEYTAEWQAIEYELQYNLNGGALQNGKTNPTKYTVETPTFTLNNPSKNGYEFLGWTTEEGQTPVETVTIAQGSIGSRTYTANWQVINYTIEYDLDGGNLAEGVTNPTSYNVETPSFTLNNPSRVGYTFKGWTSTYLTGEVTTVTIASGSTGNRSYKANWQANSGVKYKVEYYLENLEGNGYDKTEENYLSGTTNERVEIEIKTFAGFTFDENNENNVLSGNILGDESLVLKAYYSRNTYQLTLEKTENIDSVTGAGNYKYGQSVTINAVVKTEYGYEITFDKWESNNTSLLANQSTASSTFTMPAGNLSLTAKATKVATIVGYTVEYYYIGDEGYLDTPTSNDITRTGLVGSTVNVTEADKISNQIGYEFDSSAGNVLSGEVTPDGNLKLKVYFKKIVYTLKITAGTGITEVKNGEETNSSEISKTYTYGESITIDATVETEAGYEITFDKWKSNNTVLMADNATKNLTFTMPAGNLTLTAIATRTALDSNYNVEFYYQENGIYPEVANDKVTRTGKTGQTASITTADVLPILLGYEYDNNAENKVESATIKADGTTTLKVFFKQVFTITYKPGEYGIFEQSSKTAYYGAETPSYTGSLAGRDGYVFDSWTPEVAQTVTQNVEYTATWKKMDVPTITHTPTTWTNQNVTVTITKPVGYELYGVEYKVGTSENWLTYNEAFEIGENTTIYARLALDSNKGDVVDHEITNIDKVSPQFGATSINTDATDLAIITIQTTDNLSGIVEYGIKKDTDAGYEVYTCANATEKEIVFDEIYANGKYAIYLKDAAGNNIDKEIEITHIVPFMVAKIVSAPEGYENLIGTEYETLAEALSTSDAAAQIGNVKIQIIHNIHNESNTIEAGRDYTIDLNSYTVKSKSEGNNLTVNGKLNVVDESQNGQGKIYSVLGDGVYISLNGEFTLGKDEGQRSVPSVTTPIIQGLIYGVEKEIDYSAEKIYNSTDEKYYFPEAKFNFYDGKIIGGDQAMMLQKVTDTPTLFDPTIITNSETGNQESTLATVSGIEAVIGRRRYMLVEDAVAAANNTVGTISDQVEIKIVKDILKDADHKVVVGYDKNIKLDLNGFDFTTTATDYVIENYGKLEIYDSSETADVEGTGKMYSSTENTILNSISTTDDSNESYEEFDLATQALPQGTYYFESRAEGGLVSNNTRVNSSNAVNCIELDLTDKTGCYEISAVGSVSSEGGCDLGLIYVNTSGNIEDSLGMIMNISGTVDNYEGKTTIFGGKKYYIFIRYYKDGGVHRGNDCFIVSSVKYGKKKAVGELTITSGTFECSKAGSNSDAGYKGVIINDSTLNINGGKINATTTYTTSVVNSRNRVGSKVTLNGGNLRTGSAYGVLNLNYGTFNINSGDITANSTAILNKAELNVLGENVNITGESYSYGIECNANSKTTIEKGNIYGGQAVYRDNASSEVLIKGGVFSARDVAIYNYASGNIKIENATIISASTGVACYADNGVIEIDNITMNSTNDNGSPKVNYGFYNNWHPGKIIINNANVLVNYWIFGNDICGTIEVNGGTFRNYTTNYAALVNDSRVGSYTNDHVRKIKVNGGNIISQGGIATNTGDLAEIIITGGTFESKTNKGIQNNNLGTICIGEKGGTLSKESPQLKSTDNVINNPYGKFYFYDGVLIGNENNVLKGMITEIEENCDLQREVKDDDLQYVTLGIPTLDVARIAITDNPIITDIPTGYCRQENGYYYFKTLDSAIKSVNDVNNTTIEMLNDEWVIRTIEVSENKNIQVKMNNKTIIAFSDIFINNKGNIKFSNDGSENKGIIKTTAKSIAVNNEGAILEFDNIKIDYQRVPSEDKVIDNFGKLNMDNSEIYCSGVGRNTVQYTVYNEAGGQVYIDHTNFTGTHYYGIFNNSNDTMENGELKKSVVIKNSSMNFGYDIYGFGLYNNESGTIDAYKLKITGYNATYSCINHSDGKVYLEECEFIGYAITNQSAGYIECNNIKVSAGYRAIVNSSTGKYLIKGANTEISGQICNENASGIVEIQGGTYYHDSNASQIIDNYGTLTITGGNFRENGYNSPIIVNRASGIATISGADTVFYSYRQTGINNLGTMTILNGSIRGNGLYGINNSGTLTIGEKDGDIKYVPKVYGAECGLYNTGTFNFYDGILDGKNLQSIYGVTANDIEEGCMVVLYKGESEFDDGTESKYQIASAREIAVVEEIYIAHVVSNNKDYKTLNEAMAVTASTDTIELIHDASINGSQETVVIESGKNITLDLKGYNIVAGNVNTITNNGTLTVKDSTSYVNESNQTIEGKFSNGANTIIKNTGNCTIESGAYQLTLGGSADSYYHLIDNSGTVTIAGGNLMVSSAYSDIVNSTEGTVNITGGKLTTQGSGSRCVYASTGTVTVTGENTSLEGENTVYINGDAELVVDNGTFKGQIYSNSTNDVTINNITLTGNISNNSTGKIIVNNGTIEGGIYNNSTGTVEFYDGTILPVGRTYSIYNGNSGVVNIYGGSITGSFWGAIRNSNQNGIVNITGGNIRSNASGYSTEVIYNYGTVNIDGTGLTAENPIIISGIASYDLEGIESTGILNIKGYVNIDATAAGRTGTGIIGSGTVNLGDSENITNNIHIIASSRGINLPTFNYYGGRIEAPEAVLNLIEGVPNGYEIVRSYTESGKEVYEIGHGSEVARVGETKYDSLEEAITNNNSGTIELLKDFAIPNGESVENVSGKNFVLDFNGHNVKLHKNDIYLTNNGTLEITDSSNSEIYNISNKAQNAIRNEGILEISGGMFTLAGSYNEIIYNTGNGILNISNGTFVNQTYIGYIVHSDNNNDIEITGGTFNSNAYFGIYTQGEIHLDISGGTFTGGNYAIKFTSGILDIHGNTTSDNQNFANILGTATINVYENANLNNSTRSIVISGSQCEVNVTGGLVSYIIGQNTSTLNVSGGEIIGYISNFNEANLNNGAYIHNNSLSYLISNNITVNVYEGARIIGGNGFSIYQSKYINIYGGEIVGYVNAHTYSDAEVVITGGSIKGTTQGVLCDNGSVTILGGTIEATAGPGIKLTKGTVTLGEDTGGYPSKTIPPITGSTYGVQNTGGTFNFYDGILTGGTNAISGNVSNTPYMFHVVYSENETVAILDLNATFEQVAIVNGNYYDDLSTAINAAGRINATVEIFKDIIQGTEIEIAEGNEVTIDLCGFTISGFTESGTVLNNKGTLTILDSTDEGTNSNGIRSYTGTPIVNSGTLTLGIDDGNVYNAPVIRGLTEAINNTGTINKYDGKYETDE